MLESASVDKIQKEIDRVTSNWQALLDMMPEMVFIFRDDHLIEYMNPSAINVFSNLSNKFCHDVLCKTCKNICPLELAIRGETSEPLVETRIGEINVEFSSVKFHGYQGDELIMVVMRDITLRKIHEREIAEFHSNIENVLRQKIHDLEESEKNREKLLKEFEDLKSQLFKGRPADEMVGSSGKMQALRKMISQVAKTDATILITGESGTGKELAANLIRNSSDRTDMPFLKVNCNTINDSLLESELFGYEKGAFTGANAKKKGKFEIVNNGTIFLDEIGDISPRMQASLLRVLQNGEIIRVGGNEAIKVNLRIIAATNVDLSKAVKDGRFRLDLYYRLNIININIPSLRDRSEDIPELSNYFLKYYCKTFNKNIGSLSEDVVSMLTAYHWPGNIRELENVIQRAVLMAKDNILSRDNILFDSEPPHKESTTDAANINYSADCPIESKPLKEILADIEREIISKTLERHDGNVNEAAQFLQVGKTTLYDKMKILGISKIQK